MAKNFIVIAAACLGCSYWITDKASVEISGDGNTTQKQRLAEQAALDISRGNWRDEIASEVKGVSRSSLNRLSLNISTITYRQGTSVALMCILKHQRLPQARAILERCKTRVEATVRKYQSRDTTK
jgi:hypothetical protein